MVEGDLKDSAKTLLKRSLQLVATHAPVTLKLKTSHYPEIPTEIVDKIK